MGAFKGGYLNCKDGIARVEVRGVLHEARNSSLGEA